MAASGGTANTLASMIKKMIEELAKNLNIDLPDGWQEQADQAVEDWQNGQKNAMNNPSMSNNLSMLNDMRQFLKDSTARLEFLGSFEQDDSLGKNLMAAVERKAEAATLGMDSSFGVVGEPKADSAAAIDNGYAAIKVMQDPTATLESREAAGVELTKSVETLKADPAHFSGIDSPNFHCSNDLYSLEKMQERLLEKPKATLEAPSNHSETSFGKNLTEAVIAKKEPTVASTTDVNKFGELEKKISESEANKKQVNAPAPTVDAPGVTTRSAAPRP